ncbi:hypothetical protein LJR234_003257 [Mesorhizobium amorphae]|uniref:hypothetical protein n=1 Tax=Mesorhizobium amorphae TaxID=71433 RepID=UPI003ED11A02
MKRGSRRYRLIITGGRRCSQPSRCSVGTSCSDAARSNGYALMRLDTANLLIETIALCRSVGFRDCPAYNEYPDELLPYIVFMDVPLRAAEAD